MEAIDVTSLYTLGLKLQLLSQIEAGNILKDVEHLIEEPAQLLFDFIEKPLFQLSICLPAATKFLKSLAPYVNIEWVRGWDTRTGEESEWEAAVTGNPKLKFSERHISEIAEAYRNFESVLFAELRKKHIYIIPTIRAFSTDVLLNDAAKAFDSELLQYIPQRCIKDIQDAGKCLATNIPLGMSFFLFRAIEEELRSYGKSLGIINEELEDSDRNWGNYLNLVKGKGAKHGIVQFLRQIKDSYRNPLIHVDAYLTSKQAPAFFSLTIGTIELIADLARQENKEQIIS